MIPTSILAASSQRRTQHTLLNDVAYARIKEKIIALELPPASLIDEGSLAQELDLGLTPVRQALRRLAMENLVLILPRRGTLVADLNLSDLHKIFEMRIELEALAAQRAAERITADQLHAMGALMTTSEPLLESNDKTQLLEVDHQLHALIAQAAHNEFLAETLDRLYSHIRRLWNLSLDRVTGLADGVREHDEILAAIRAGDGERAAALMRAHVQRFQKEVATLL